MMDGLRIMCVISSKKTALLVVLAIVTAEC